MKQKKGMKKQGEIVETYIARFELARMKAAREANILYSWNMYARRLLNHIHIKPDEYQRLVESTNGQLPNNEADYYRMLNKLRERSRILENIPGNIARSIAGQPSGQRSYVTDQRDMPPSPYPPNSWDNFQQPHLLDIIDQAHARGEFSMIEQNLYGGNASSSSAAPQGANVPSDTQTAYLTQEAEMSGTDSDTSSDQGEPLSESDDEKNLKDAPDHVKAAVYWGQVY